MLAENRARLAELTAQADPTFASLVVPVEELSYRLSRVFSPISHLNAVANSAQMREAYNECVPLLTDYSSELGQNTALQAGYAHVLKTEGDALDSAQRKLLENALRDFRLAGVDLPPAEKARYREVAQRLAQLATKFSENVLDAGRAYTRSVTNSAELAGLPANAVDRAAADAREVQQAGWLFKLDQPTYMTIMAGAESEQLRRDFYEAWITRASELGPSAGRFDNNAIIAEILALRDELAKLLKFANYADFYALATREWRRAASRCLPSWMTWRQPLPTRGARRILQSRGVRRAQAQHAWDLAYYSRNGCRKAAFQRFPPGKHCGRIFPCT